MIFINKQIKNLKPSATLAINQKVKELRAAKKEVYHFGFGQSPFPIHPRIINKLVHNAGNNHYLPTMGLESLRKQIAEFLTSYHKVPTAMDNVLVGPGSKELLFQTILILEGRFLIPKGSWVSYGPQIKSKGVQYDVLDTKLEDNFKLTPDILEAYCEAYPDEQKTLILNSPNNPTGAVYSSDELIGLSKVCRTYSVIILSDEIYALINFYQNTSPSMAEYYPERTFVFGGLSKIFSAGGYRLGFVRLPSEFNELSNTFRSLFSETFSAVASPVQFSAIEAFRMPKEIEYCINVNNTVLKLIAEYVHEKLSKFGIECTIPQGAFYLMIGFNKFKTKIKDKLNIDNSADLAIYILDNYNVALLPGLDFYFKPEDLFFRLAYVDFDGKNLIESNDFSNFNSLNLLQTYCPNIINGVDHLINFIHDL